MKHKFLTTLILFFLILTLDSRYAKKNKILFKVDNEIITSIDMLQEVTYLTVFNNELKKMEKNVVYEIAKKSLIKHKIKELELLKKIDSYEVPQDVLNKLILNRFRKININSTSELKKFLDNKSIDLDYVEQRVKIQVLWNEFIFAKFSKQIKIDKEKIKKDLETQKYQNEYLLSEILFNIEKNENFEKKIESINQTILKKSFEEAAFTFSISGSAINGGKLDWIKETSLNPKIRNEINTIEVGEITNPIVIPGGFLILKVNNKRASEIKIDLNSSIKQISEKKINEQLNQFSNLYFNKIKKNISINEY